jgi:electron transfer flavoprotein beta subunit
MLAEFLDMPSVSAISNVEMENGEVKITRDIDGGKELVTTKLPFVAIVQKGIAKEPMIAAMRGIMMARKKPLQVVNPSAVDALTEITTFELPQPKPPCKMFEPENIKELVDTLQNEAKVI